MVSFSLQLEISKHLDGQLLNVQDLFDGLLNYISCTTEEIIQVFLQDYQEIIPFLDCKYTSRRLLRSQISTGKTQKAWHSQS